jgi:hypothetical protein
MSKTTVDYLRGLLASFVPAESAILWGSVWMFALLTRSFYANYLATFYIWIDGPLATALMRFIPSYCTEMHMITAFYSTIVSHLVVRKSTQVSIHPYTLAVCTASVVLTLVSLLEKGQYTFAGICVAAAVGSVSGVLRVLLYFDSFGPHIRWWE